MAARGRGGATGGKGGASREARGGRGREGRTAEDRRAPVTYGYARVSTRDQNQARQRDALAAAGVDAANVYRDKASGKDFARPAWRALVGELRAGDTLVVGSIDRLGRDYDEILETWRTLTKELGVDVVVLDMPLLDTRVRPGDVTGAFVADLVLQILSYVAQVERESIRQRQAEGIAAAKARGVHCGRPPIPRPAAYGRTRDACLAGHLTRAEAARRLGVSVTTFDKWVRQDRAGGALP